jgi:hypothetical protein
MGSWVPRWPILESKTGLVTRKPVTGYGIETSPWRVSFSSASLRIQVFIHQIRVEHLVRIVCAYVLKLISSFRVSSDGISLSHKGCGTRCGQKSRCGHVEDRNRKIVSLKPLADCCALHDFSLVVRRVISGTR